MRVIGDYRLDETTTSAIEARRLAWRDKDKLSPITVNKLLTTMTAIFNEAVRLGKAKYNPAASAKRLGVGSVEASDKENAEIRPEEVYNADELNRLIQNAETGFLGR